MSKPIPPASPDTVRGPLTGTPLDGVRRLCLPHRPDTLGYLRPPLDHTAMVLSLELANMTYTLDLEPWMRAGWTDISIQVDNRLQSGVTVGTSESAGSERMRGLINAWKLTRARMALKEYNPVAQVMAAFRQRDRSDTIKAVTLIHPAPKGRYTVAIGFMGTGSRFYDWFSNFRFTAEEGFHKGFAQLTQVFLESAGRIQFPETAAALGLPALTLSDVLREMRSPDSRFTLWMAGHSQGGAVMQVFCHRLLTDWQVLPRHIVGYGFASPTVLAGDAGRSPANYPLWHLVNTDDLVPRVGALMHLGLCLRYPADEALRTAAYGWPDDPADAQDRAQAEALMEHVTDTPTMLESLAALCETIAAEVTEENLAALTEKWWSLAPLDKAFTFAGGKMKEQLLRMARYARVAYRSVAGRRMDEAAVASLRERMRPIVREIPARRLMAALKERYYPPHRLCRANRATGAYGYLVGPGSARLYPACWLDASGAGPRLCQGESCAVFIPAPLPGAAAATPPRRVGTHGPARRSPRSRGVTLRRNASGVRPMGEAEAKAARPQVQAAHPSRRRGLSALRWTRRSQGKRKPSRRLRKPRRSSEPRMPDA